MFPPILYGPMGVDTGGPLGAVMRGQTVFNPNGMIGASRIPAMAENRPPFANLLSAPRFPAPFVSEQSGQDDEAEDTYSPSGPEAPSGPSAPKRHGFLHKLTDRPGGRDALMAFGAALLSAPTFAQGMGQGIMAYQAALRAGEDRAKKNSQPVNNSEFERIVDPVTGEVTYRPNKDIQDRNDEVLGKKATNAQALQNLRDNSYFKRLELQLGTTRAITQMQIDASNGRQDAQLAMERYKADLQADATLAAARIAHPDPSTVRSKFDLKAEDDYGNLAMSAPENISMYDQMESLLTHGHTGAGPGMMSAAARALAKGLGMDIAGVNVGDNQILEQGYKTLELRRASLLQGQGALSDAERRILSQSVPSIQTDPKAAAELMRTMRAIEQRRQQIFSEWEDGGNKGGETFRQFAARRERELITGRSRTDPGTDNQYHPPGKGGGSSDLRKKYGLE